VFREGDPDDYEIVGQILECFRCDPPDANGQFLWAGRWKVEFGPYIDPPTDPSCDPAADTVLFTLVFPDATLFREEQNPADPGMPRYEPVDGNLTFPRDPGTPLETACALDSNLDYSITDFELSGALGAETTGTVALTLPTTVRARDDAGSLIEQLSAGPPFVFRQDLSFETPLPPQDPGPMFRLWPDGLPFRLGPDQLGYKNDAVSFDFAAPGGGRTSYEPAFPDATDIPPGFGVELPCSDPDCTPPAVVHNGGYFATTEWIPAAGSFDKSGVDLDLTLPAMESVTYQSIFPRGVTPTLTGAATIQVRNSAVEGGSFDDGQVKLEYGGPGDCAAADQRTLALIPGTPTVEPDGLLQAGIGDLDADLDPAPNDELSWSFNEAEHLDCGTLVVGPVVNDKGPAGGVQGPQHTWLASAVTPVKGRGLYAGLNYNRRRVCALDGTPDGTFCLQNGDCVGGATCDDLHLAPHCPSLDPGQMPLPTWTARIEDQDVVFQIDPAAVSHADREMAFFARASGVTGVFDGGVTAADIGNPTGDPATFDIGFSEFGLAFRDSSNAGPPKQDSLVSGVVKIEWPSLTDLPFEGMSICDCGNLDAAEVPEQVVSRTLAYWDTEFRPYGLNFSALAIPDCLDPDGSGCAARACLGGDDDGLECDPEDPDPCPGGGACQAAISRSVCVQAETLVEHVTPEFFHAVFDVDPSGNPGQIRPVGGPRFKLDEYPMDGPHYPFDVTSFVFSDHELDGEPTQTQVENNMSPYGYLDAKGDLTLPLFGLSRAGIKIQKRGGSGGDHLVDAHDPDLDPVYYDQPATPNDSAFMVLREMGAGNLRFRYRVDYFTPGMTADGQDGTDASGIGRFLGFSFPDPADGSVLDGIALGAVEVPSGVMMDPDQILGDVGVTAIVRQWSSTVGEGRQQLENLMSGAVDRLDPTLTGAYQDALSVLGNVNPAFDVDDLGQTAEALTDALHETLAIDELVDVPDASAIYNATVPGVGISASELTGYLDLSGDLGDVEWVDTALVDAALSTGGEFFSFARSQLSVQRQVEQADEVLTEMGRKLVPSSMALPGQQDIDFFPDFPGVQWHFDYDIVPGPPPVFTFQKLRGSIDLTEGGLSGLEFGELGATLIYEAGGNWYFQAGLAVDFKQVAVEGDVLLGNTTDTAPLRALDPEVADFLGEIERFDGAYVRCGATYTWIDVGCLLRIRVGAEVGGWYIKSEDTFGGKLGGWVTGRGACLVSVKGEMNLIGGKVDDLFKLRGDYWVAGGIGFDCDEDSWDTPRKALRDGGCLVCVMEADCTYTHPGSEVSFRGPDFTCR
jgi:hypothetical protein